jgi:hypothetical protein
MRVEAAPQGQRQIIQSAGRLKDLRQAGYHCRLANYGSAG